MMRLFLLIEILICLIYPIYKSSIFSQQQNLDYAFILDTSGSMEGKPTGSGNVVIFPNVKKVLKEFLQDIEIGSNVHIFPFDEGIHNEMHFAVDSRADIETIKDSIDNLKAEGKNTWIYYSLMEAINKINSFRETITQSKIHPTMIYVYTDGLDNSPKRFSIDQVMREFSLQRDKHDWIYYCTLGVKLPKEEKDILENTDHVKVIEEERSEVHPLYLINAKLPLLNFGNFLKTDESTRTQLFIIHNKDKLPQNIKIGVDSHFLTLQRIGAAAEFSPKSFIPEEKVPFTLHLINKENIKEGEYEGYIIFKTNDPLVQVVPDTMRALFTYEPEKIVNILPQSGMEFPIDFGEIAVKSKKDTLTISRNVLFDFNTQAIEKGGILRVRIDPAIDNPSKLIAGKNILLNGNGDEYITLGPNNKELEIKFILNPDLEVGKYQGVLAIKSDDMNMIGEGLDVDPQDQNIRYLQWTFTIPAQPLAWYSWLLIIVIILLILSMISFTVFSLVQGETPISKFKSIITKPKLDGALLIKAPDERRGEEYSLANKAKVKIGTNGEFLPDAESAFTIEATYEGGKLIAILEVNEGNVSLKKSNENLDSSVFREEIYNNDIISFDKYKIEFQSFNFERGF